MALNEYLREYRFTDAELKQLSDITGINVTRDMTDFSTRGVSAATVTALEALITAFDNYPTDSELLGMVSLATEEKDAIAEQIRIAIRKIRSMAEIKYGKAGKYKIFDFKDMAALSDNELDKLAKRVVRVGTTYLTELTSEGLTQAMLTALTDLYTDFDDALDTKEIAIETRNQSTQERVEKGNTLYTEVSRLCAIGRALYVDTNPAKYEDYVIYGSNYTPPALKGTVKRQENQEPIVEAHIHIAEPDITITTNADGKFYLQTLAAGAYNLECTKTGFQTVAMPFTIVEAVTTDLLIEMVPV
jgi:hypothetical protein